MLCPDHGEMMMATVSAPSFAPSRDIMVEMGVVPLARTVARAPIMDHMWSWSLLGRNL